MGISEPDTSIVILSTPDAHKADIKMFNRRYLKIFALPIVEHSLVSRTIVGSTFT